MVLAQANASEHGPTNKSFCFFFQKEVLFLVFF
jgi:hypothetical protein